MAFDWSSITAQTPPDKAYYRLLGEMLHRRATDEDLQGVRTFLAASKLTSDVWFSLGEGLFHTTDGSSTGYRMWCAWSRSVLDGEFDDAQQADAWRTFLTGTSDGLEHSSEPATISMLLDSTDDGISTRIVPPDAVERSPSLAQDITTAVALIPSGPHTIRLFDEVFEQVDEFALLALLRRGVFLGLDVLFGVRWLHVAEHPGFVPIVQRLRDEALAELSRENRVPAEVTQAGVQ